jgi:hypothetical protein
MWKEDIDGCFPQLFLHPRSALLSSLPLPNGLLYIHINGYLGASCMGMAWDVVGRCIDETISTSIRGVIHRYCDDFMGLGTFENCLHDQTYVQQFCRDVIGRDAINKSKTIPPSKQADILGWRIDLEAESIRPSDKAIDKLVFVFFHIDSKAAHPLRVWQLLSSLAELYSNGIIGMRSYVRPFHHMVAKFKGRTNFSIAPSSAARLCIEIWRIHVFLLWSNPTLVTVPLYHLIDKPLLQPMAIVMSDAGPDMVSCFLYDINGSLLAWSTLQMPFQDPDNLHQNLREYLGYITAVLLGLRIFVSDSSLRVFHCRGDSKTALSWIRDNMCRSASAQYAGIIWAWLQIYARVVISDTSHVAGTLMGEIDAASRHRDHINLDHSKYFSFQSIPIMHSILELCNPFNTAQVKDHHSTFMTIHSTLTTFLRDISI